MNNRAQTAENKHLRAFAKNYARLLRENAVLRELCGRLVACLEGRGGDDAKVRGLRKRSRQIIGEPKHAKF